MTKLLFDALSNRRNDDNGGARRGGAERGDGAGRSGAANNNGSKSTLLRFARDLIKRSPHVWARSHGLATLGQFVAQRSWPNVAPRTPASRHTVPKTISKPQRHREAESRHTKQMRGDPGGDRKYTPPSPQITNKRQRKGRERLAGTTPTRPPEQHAAAARATPAIDAPQSGASAPRPGP